MRSKVSGVHAVQSMRMVFCNGGKYVNTYMYTNNIIDTSKLIIGIINNYLA